MQTSIVVFTKVPKSGETKTRLTTERGGVLTNDEARMLYEGCLVDVLNVCLKADCGAVKVCYNAGGDLDCLEQLLARSSDRSKIAEVYPDQGGSFDTCMQFAADHILKSVSEPKPLTGIVIVGGDIPTLQPYILQDAVRKLNKLSSGEAGIALVEGACQEGGFSLVGFTSTTPFDFTGVFYNQDGITALDMLVAKAVSYKIPLGVVEAIPDVDIPVDLAGMIPIVKALHAAAAYDTAILAPVHTIAVLEDIGLESTATPPQR